MTTGLTVALAGNPNCGKTTIFNNITGARQHVGNYPGVTVEKREGSRQFQGKDLLVVDLPGTYSLRANALDEIVARDAIINDKPDIIANIIDASNLERNLYLAVQILELERPVVLALNMADVAEKMGIKINDEALSRKLGVPVVRTVGNRNEGTEALLQVVVNTAAQNGQQQFILNYGPQIEAKIKLVSDAIATLPTTKYPRRWLAIKLLEHDPQMTAIVGDISGGAAVLTIVEQTREELKPAVGGDLEVAIAELRYRFVGEVYRQITVVANELSQTTSDKIDSILTNRLLGLPIFLGIMWLLFNMVFTVGQYPQEWMQDGAKSLAIWVGSQMADGDLKSLVVDGIIGGVGTVISFLPQILLLFFGIALLEDTGYMARAAFVMDRTMRAVGLHGKSFIPLLIGFGCNIPAIMGARTLDNPRDRMVTILVAPLMSCSARLPVYTLLCAAFFSEQYAGTIMFSIYLLGILLAVVMSLVFRKFLFPGSTEPFVMEMPLYHLPTLRSIVTHMWERSALYVKKAGTIILAVSILVWFLFSYPNDVPYSKDFDQAKATVEETFTAQVNAEILIPLHLEKLEDNEALQQLVSQIDDVKSGAEKAAAKPGESASGNDIAAEQDSKLNELETSQPELYPYALKYWEYDQQQKDETEKLDREKLSEKMTNSYAGRFGHSIEPLIKPLGFDWKMGVGLFAGFAAKEVLVSTLGTVYSVGEVEDDTNALQDALTSDPAFSPLIAYVLMVFTLIYTPCMAAVAVIRRETCSWKWAAFSVAYSIVLAWIVSFGVYHIGLVLGY